MFLRSRENKHPAHQGLNPDFDALYICTRVSFWPVSSSTRREPQCVVCGYVMQSCSESQILGMIDKCGRVRLPAYEWPVSAAPQPCRLFLLIEGRAFAVLFAFRTKAFLLVVSNIGINYSLFRYLVL